MRTESAAGAESLRLKPSPGRTRRGRRSQTSGPRGLARHEAALTCDYSTGRFFRSSNAVTSLRYSSHSCFLLRRKKS